MLSSDCSLEKIDAVRKKPRCNFDTFGVQHIRRQVDGGELGLDFGLKFGIFHKPKIITITLCPQVITSDAFEYL